MNLILFDDATMRGNLLPLTFTRPVAEIRIGILTIREKWEKRLSSPSSTLTETYLQAKYPILIDSTSDHLWVNASICPNDSLIAEIKAVKSGQALFKGSVLIALNSGKTPAHDQHGKLKVPEGTNEIEANSEFLRIANPWDIFKLNGEALQEDYELLTRGRKSSPLSDTNTALGNNIFIEPGAKVECAILNSLTGPIYIGKESEVMEGSIIRGPFSLGEHSTLKMGAKIYGPTTIGPFCKAGGEISNSVLFGFSNKGHDGFLGNSVLGEWCNLGADTNNSNLKNNYGIVKMHNYVENKQVSTGLQFCGLVMGDHSKTGINTMLNTGTVVGVCTNIFGGGFPGTFVPDFSWGGVGAMETYKLDKAIEVASRVLERRSLVLNEKDKNILSHIFKLTAGSRAL